MSGFKAFVLKGDLVDLAVAFIIGTAFGLVVTTFTNWLTSLLPDMLPRSSATTRTRSVRS